jgi:hypothetical protein
MAEILRPMQLSVEKQLDGRIKIGFGQSMGLLTPDQAVEFAMVLLERAGMGNVGLNSIKSPQKHFRAG